MKKVLLCSTLILLLMTGMAHATLTTIGTATYNGAEYKLIWDDDNNGTSVVWLDYTNDSTDWTSQVAWAAILDTELTINLYEDYTVEWDSSWRLPTTVDGAWHYGYDGTTTGGFNITTSELGHLFYTELGNLGTYDTTGNEHSEYGLSETGDFENLYASIYWSGTDYAGSTSYAWYFHMVNGGQYGYNKRYGRYGLAVRSGQVSVSSIPIPGAILLLGSGLLGMAAAGRKKGKRRLVI